MSLVALEDRLAKCMFDEIVDLFTDDVEFEEQPPRWPRAVVMPFHYRHPVTGRPIPDPR